jgi:Zn-dependent metalloprotease
MKVHFYKILPGILLAIYLSSMVLPGAAVAGSQQIGTPQPEPERGVNPETGRVAFIGAGAPISVPGVTSSNGISPQNRALSLVDAYGGEFGLADPARELKLLASRKDDNGNDLVRYQQVYNGVPVLAGEMIVNMNAQGQLLSVSGEVSPGLTLDTNPAVTAQAAAQTALAEMAKLHQVAEAQLTASDPELWIFDESLLTGSLRPTELVWRLEVTSAEVPLPIRERVLVNAQTGEISFHVNQVDAGIAPKSVDQTAPRTAVLPSITCAVSTGSDPVGGLFLPYKQYNCGKPAYGVGAGDFNHDGKEDVAMTIQVDPIEPHAVLVFIQDANGNLLQPQVYAAGRRSEDLAVGDLNHDGLEDLVTADFIDSTISVFLQRSDGTLADRVTYVTGTDPDAIAVGDVNNDGRQDVAVSHWNSPTIGVFTQKADGTLNAMTTYPSIAAGYDDIAVGDVSGDGRNDVVKMNGQITDIDLMVYVQNNNQTLNPPVNYFINNCTSFCLGHEVGIGDVTGDGRGDVVLTYGGNGSSANVAVFPQDANGSLQASHSYSAYDIPEQVAITDINSDTRLDVVTLHNGWLHAGVFLQTSNGTLDTETLYTLPNLYTRALDIGDVNGDGLPDMVIADNLGLVVLYRNGTPPSMPTAGPGPTRTPGPTSTAGPSPTPLSPSSTGSRRTYTAAGSVTIPGTFLCNQNQVSCTNGADVDADNAHRYAADTFVFYNTHHGRNSFDNQGGTIDSTVHFGIGYQNAFWDGTRMVYGDNMAADDVVGHEITHGVTQYASNLIYSYQSGAINESLSDIWGEFIDQTNGSGNDSASVKWLVAEDSAMGALRSMSDPTLFGDPDKMSSPYYYHGSADNGGVHWNSGVNNKAAYLMTQGGTFNGRTITGIGLNKTAAVYYEAQANLLTAGSNYNDLYYILIQACQNLTGGSSGITQNDCNQVRTAAEAVEMVVVSAPTPTPTSTPPYSYNPLYLSLTSSQAIGGVASADEDILRFDGTSWSLLFDGSDVGVGSPDLFAFTFLDGDSLLMSFGSNVTVNGIAATPQDILRFDATSLGSTTSGTWSLYFDGSDVGLADATAEKIDALSVMSDGTLLLSTNGNPAVTGVSGARDEDILGFAPISLGSTTDGVWAVYFDGSDVGLGETSGEDVDALDVVGSNIYLSTQDNFAVAGVSGADEDVFVCTVTSLGPVTACSYSSSLYFDGSSWGLTANDVDAVHVLVSGPSPTAVPTNTPTAMSSAPPPATITPTRTPTATATSKGGGTFTFSPLADAYVNAGSPTSNYGSSTALRMDASPDLHSYLRFNVQGLSGPVTRATLRVYANSASSLGCTVHSVSDNTWSESTINYNNAPAAGGPLRSSGAFGAAVWIEIDLTPYITGNGTYNLALLTSSSTAVSFASREAGTNGPQLIIVTGP